MRVHDHARLNRAQERRLGGNKRIARLRWGWAQQAHTDAWLGCSFWLLTRCLRWPWFYIPNVYESGRDCQLGNRPDRPMPPLGLLHAVSAPPTPY